VKVVTNALPKDLKGAIAAAAQARANGQSTAFAGGGSDLLGQMKDRVVSPDVLVYLKSIKGLDTVATDASQTTIGGLMTLDALARHETIRKKYLALARAANTVATPQIRNVATLAGNVCQRPWCWYYRNGFPCLKNGGNRCFSIDGENQFHAIFGGGPSYIVHPSDTAPALVALDASFRISGPAGERTVPAADFFVLPKDDARRENVLKDDEVLSAVVLPNTSANTRSAYFKVMDREAWTHAIISVAVVLDMDPATKGLCRSARIVLGGVAPIPWRVPAVENLLKGQRVTSALAEKAGAVAVEGARPLSKNAYKVTMLQTLVMQSVGGLAEAWKA
jgi:xanthine dehydrogenase YagS FAD-binding subunit